MKISPTFRGGPEDTLVVRRLPRLGRSLKDLLSVVEALEEKGSGFRSLVEGLRTDTAHGRMVFSIFGALAEFERELICERTQAGLEAARKRGRVGGRPAAMTEEDAEVAQSLMKSGEVPVKQICETVGVSRSTLYRYVSPERRTTEVRRLLSQQLRQAAVYSWR